MTLKECYQILGLNQSASLEEVKRVYRRRAFELHPDLNPGVADASRQFQRLNEAYVILSKLISVREEREGKKKAASRESAQTPHSEQNAEKPSSTAAEEASAKKTAENANHSTNATHDTSSGQKTASDKSRPGHEAESDKGAASTTSGMGATSGSETPKGSASSSHTAGHRQETEHETRHPPRDNVYTEQQEVLHDILNDPFARRVFEDIYSEIRKNAPKTTPVPSPSVKKKPVPSPLSNLLNWGQRRINLEFSNGIGGALKGWLRNQIDEEQLFELPANRLIPGARIRLQIRHGFSDEVKTLDVTLPPDFKPENPIRLKGMGKKLGHWQGDLYLRFSAKA